MRIKGQRRKLTQADVERARIPRRFWHLSYSSIPESARSPIQRYMLGIDGHLDAGDGLLLWGPNGVGKTSIAVLVAFEAMRRGASALFMTSESIRQSYIEGSPFDDDFSMIDRARIVDVLVIDDMAKEHRGDTEFAERMLENLLRQRAAARKTTIITTNLSIVQDDRSERRKASLAAVYPASLVEVIQGSLYPVQVIGPDQRKTEALGIQERMAA